MMTKFLTVHKTGKDHKCYECDRVIPKGSMCTYGVTTDSEITSKGIVDGYFCTACRDVAKNTVNA